MTDSNNSPTTTSGSATAKQPSCILCRKRKVKCDRKYPCSNCIRANAECIFRESIPARHHKRRAEHALLSRLRHYESLLRQHGIDPGVNSDDVATTAGGGSTEVQHEMSALRLSDSKPASSPLEDSDCIPDESDTESADYLSPKHENESFLLDHGYDVLFSAPSNETLSSLHPDPVHIFKLWQVFLENVNPLTKVIHAPVLQQQMLNAIGDLSSMGKGMEALLFSIYSCALHSMTDEEVQKELGQEKSLLQARFRIATQKALANAGLLKTTDLVLLQAFCLYLVSCRSTYDRRTTWCLSGTAIRIAQQMGLHRDGSNLGLSVFETEMRRRVWWHIIYMDKSITRSSGFISAPLPANDTHYPLNVNDSDLHPNMKEPPVERNDIGTDMIFSQLRQELGKWQERQPQFVESMFSGTDEKPQLREEKAQRRQKAVDEFRAILHDKIVRFCDPSIPLHILVNGSAHTITSVMQLVVTRPFYLWVPDLKLPPLSRTENDELFATCLDLIRHNGRLRNDDVLRRFIWHLDWHLPWPIMLYMISELSKRSVLSEDTRQAWKCMDDLFVPYHQRLGPEARGPLHIVCLRLAAKAWSSNLEEYQSLGVPVPSCPRIVELLNKHSSASKGRKGTPSRSDQGPTVSSSAPSTGIEQEQQHQQGQQPVYTTTYPGLPQGTYVPGSENTGNAQYFAVDNLNLPDMFGESPSMLSNDGVMIDWVDWDPFFQHIPPHGVSNF
ncbi:conserved hypothetical protein [Talaromyces marneffei ATCC 18224]|uniref:Zn(2)-C6 fungal-type domain-containing protein n=1 Tax=Talaromyces marneffei (strain ATCC 18224 / CBS 334.59 / QM 7333) TaxID=441960 RepID=B6QCH1_TALMQ|nr:conserved hypothetical protein [Talaromyces marneffei ATCC 18224]